MKKSGVIKYLLPLFFLSSCNSNRSERSEGESVSYTEVSKKEKEIFDGHIYSVNDNSSSYFKYERKFDNAGDETFITVYKIFDPNRGSEAITITATHWKYMKYVQVKAQYSSGVMRDINIEDVKYKTESLNAFGKEGTYRLLGGNSIPAQIAVKFVDTSYTYINVVNVAGSHVNGMWDQFFILDKI